MMRVKELILCEGDSDQILIGEYLSKMNNLVYAKKLDADPFPREPINWYCDENDNYLGVWNAKGCFFAPAVSKIFSYEKSIDHIIESLAVVTDFDDEKAEHERFKELLTVISKVTELYEGENTLRLNKNSWNTLEFIGGFDQRIDMCFCYLLVPFDSQGALETFMLKALSEKSEDKKQVICQVKEFVKNLKSDEYLRKRREKIKAELGISVSVFNPEKMFDTMMELITCVDWAQFDQTEKQFGILREKWLQMP